MRVYCETSVLPENIRRHDDSKSRAELAAMIKLAGLAGRKDLVQELLGSHVVSYEAGRTKDETKRRILLIEARALKPVPNERKPLGCTMLPISGGGFVGYANFPTFRTKRFARSCRSWSRKASTGETLNT